MMLDRLTALVVDDDPISASILENYLNKLAFEVISCTNGKTGYEILLHQHEILDLVITDIVMPDMDGRELIHLIRSNPATNDLPVIVVSGLVNQNELKDLCENYNKQITEYLTKPIDFKELERVLDELHIRVVQ